MHMKLASTGAEMIKMYFFTMFAYLVCFCHRSQFKKNGLHNTQLEVLLLRDLIRDTPVVKESRII